MPISNPFSRSFALMACAAVMMAGDACAQSDQWDDLLTGSQWFVPAENLLAYITPGGSFATPTAVADQTIWTITSSVDGVFTGTSVATFKSGPVEVTSTTTMNGTVNEAGQVRIVFSQEGGPSTVGIGQVQVVEGKTLFEMQMISGSDTGSFYITHWAYMEAWDGESLPNPEIEASLRSEEWRWMHGTTWNVLNDDLFGIGETGTFRIDGYRNGYFWGSGSGPEGSEAAAFTLLGSATPEGTLLFNLLAGDGTMTSLTGKITGDATNGQMEMWTYLPDDTTTPGYAYVIPEPSSILLLGLGAGALLRWRRSRRNPKRAGTPGEWELV